MRWELFHIYKLDRLILSLLPPVPQPPGLISSPLVILPLKALLGAWRKRFLKILNKRLRSVPTSGRR